MAAGKTTVARLLAARFNRGVHLEGDIFRRSIVSGRAEITPDLAPEELEQLRLRYELAATAVDRYAQAGFTVVYEDVIAGPFLAETEALIHSRPIHVVVLLPAPEAIAERAVERTSYGADWTIGELHERFAQETPRVGLWLDTSEQTPEQTVDAILAET